MGDRFSKVGKMGEREESVNQEGMGEKKIRNYRKEKDKNWDPRLSQEKIQREGVGRESVPWAVPRRAEEKRGPDRSSVQSVQSSIVIEVPA